MNKMSGKKRYSRSVELDTWSDGRTAFVIGDVNIDLFLRCSSNQLRMATRSYVCPGYNHRDSFVSKEHDTADASDCYKTQRVFSSS